MPFKKHTPEQIIGKLREAEIVLAQGGTRADACRRLSISEQTYYRWRKEYGGLKTDQARRMKDLEKENARLRRAISDLTLDKLILQEAARGNYRALRDDGAVSIMSARNCLSLNAASAAFSASTDRRSVKFCAGRMTRKP
jgi:transposase-like protein